MKAATLFHLALGLLIGSLLALSPAALAQQNGTPQPAEKYSREELTQMLAPIALYPDALLSQILMASTYPIEVIEADRWVKNHPRLKGEQLDAALLDNDWDPSVKTLCHFPSVLALMSEKIGQTTDLGNAFLAQEEEVMAVVQELRARAYAQGNLTSNAQQKVIVTGEVIIIEPYDPRVIYVPYYDPFYIYGSWWYPAFLPYYWLPPGVRVSVGISYWPPFYFGFIFTPWCYFDWHQHTIIIDVHRRPRYVRPERWIVKPARWQHHPRHRRGVAYRDKSTARKYGQYPKRVRKYQPESRGFPAQQERDRRTIERQKQERERVQERQRLAPPEPPQQRPYIERQRRERTEQERSERQRREETVVDRDGQERQRVEQEERTRQRVESEQQQRGRDYIFNRVDEGRRERQSSERGWSSRQGRGGGDEREDRRRRQR